MKHYCLLKVAWVVVGTFAALCVYMLYLMFWPFKTVVYHKVPFPVLKKTVCIGEELLFEVQYTRYSSVTTEQTVTIVNDMVHYIPGTLINAPMGSRTGTGRVLIPHGIVPGTYHLEIMLTWRINPLRTIQRRVSSEPFQVVAK